MLQMSDSVASFMNGSMTALSGSGTTNMSLAWMGAQPRMEDPSKPSPSSKTASVNSAIGMVKCCQRPTKSMNFRSTITAFLSCASPTTSLPFAIFHSSVCAPSKGTAAAPLTFLERRLASFARADADDLVHGGHEDLAVPDAPGLGRALDRLQGFWHHLVGQHHLDLHFWQEVDDVLGAPVQLGVPFLTPESLHLGDGETQHADVRQRLLHLVELEGLDDGFDLLHAVWLRDARTLLAPRPPRNGRLPGKGPAGP